MIMLKGPNMNPQPLEIRIVETAEGVSPYLRWYRRQSAELKAEVDARLVQVRKRNFGDHRRLAKGVIELRIHHGPGIRVYGGEWQGRFFLLLKGGQKAGQSADIDAATRLWLAFTKSK